MIIHKTLLALFLVGVLLPPVSSGHEAGTVQLTLSVPDRTVRAEMDLVDLDYVLGVDANGDAVITAADIGLRQAAIARYVADNITVGGCGFRADDFNVGLRRAASPSVIVDAELDCTAEPSSVASSLLAELPNYRTILLVGSGGTTTSFVLDDAVALDIAEQAGFPTFFTEGVYHILIGIDHIAFLLILVLPLALHGTWQQRLRSTAGIVTAFTVAHSITLTLSALGHISLPARPVELVIAVSVVFAALFNLAKSKRLHGGMLAYVFGLIHGFGFAGALGDLAIADGLTVSNLLAFNLGVEAGQLLIIAVALPILSGLGRLKGFRSRLVPAGSTAIAVLGMMWIVERF